MARKARKQKWFDFKSPTGERWSVFFSLRCKHPSYFAGKKNVGATWWGGRYKHQIYIDAGQNWEAICLTLIHEIFHVVFRPLGLSKAIDEAVVEDVSDSFANILFQIMPSWPEYEGD